MGKVRYPAFSSHSIPMAIDLMKTGKFAAVQLPFNFVDNTACNEAIPLAKELDMGFIGMKPFGGGLLDDAGMAIRYVLQFENVIPDPGIEKLWEMQEIVSIVNEKKPLSPEDKKNITVHIQKIGDHWCHRCDYCQPCPQGIGISSVLTVESLLKRMPFEHVFKMVNANMERAHTCLECGDCIKRCPYKLQIPGLIKNKISLWEKAAAEKGRQQHTYLG
jgi:predicted aldo/keto reductase-like oxidoreductase